MTNFLLTPHPKARIEGASRILAANPYVVHALEKSGELRRYEHVAVATQGRTTREAFLRDHDLVDRKHRMYLPIVAWRLNHIHGKMHGQRFWEKAIALALLRHITLCLDVFQACESHLRPDEHECRILSDSSFYVPSDFNDHRRFFQHSDYGQEQLFSAYCRMFYPARFDEWTDRHAWPDVIGVPSKALARAPSWSERLSPKRIARRLLRMRSPSVGVIKSFFSQEHLDRLLFESRGRIQSIFLPTTTPGQEPIDVAKRHAVAREEPHFDRFDRFAFAALHHGMPRAFVEDFASLVSTYERLFSQYPKLDWIVSEAWIGDMYSAVALAVAGARGIRHLCNEHNYIAYPFLGNHLKYIIPLADAFTTLGWRSSDHPSAIRSGSLFKWTDTLPLPGGQDILYIASLAQVRAPEVNASYGESGPVNVPRYFEFVERFLKGLSDACLRGTVMRVYPTALPRTMQAWDFKYCLREQLGRVKRVDESERGARALMRKAKLVIIDYFSTSFIETMLADVPMVFLWNRNTRYPLDKHGAFFAQLIDAGICQTDPEAAAAFVERIKEDPNEWWQRPEVRAARQAFLSANIGDPQLLIDHLLHLARQRDAATIAAGCPGSSDR